MNNLTLPTIAGLATPNGSGALHIIRVSGTHTYQIMNEICAKPVLKNAHTVELNYIVGANEHKIDQVVLVKYLAPKSYTGEDLVEINCHGNMLIVQLILEQLLKHGVHLAKRGDFSKRAFLLGKIDLNQANAILNLAQATNQQQIHAAVYNLQGKISSQVQQFHQDLLQIIGEIEINIDYPDELNDEFNLNLYQKLIHQTQILLTQCRTLYQASNNQKLSNWKIVIVGRANAGKSSLINCLINQERVIVSNIAGTTRDVIEVDYYLNGNIVTFVDTAGIHETHDQLETIAIQKSYQAIANADLIIHLIDCSQLNHPEDQVIANIIKTKPHITVYNKHDLKPMWHPNAIAISIIKGEITPLLNHLSEIVATQATNYSQFGLASQTGIDELINAIKQLETGLMALENHEVIDLVAEHFHLAYDHLANILGIGHQDLILDIFDNFCVGK